MKKIFYLTIASVVALAGCTKFAHDAAFEPINTGAPVISETQCTETTLHAVVTPADDKTTYFAYAVIGGGKKDLDANLLLTDKYKDLSLTSGCIDTEVAQSVTIDVTELDNGYTYTLYTVATSKTGTVSEISTYMFILDDKAAPSFEESDVESEIEDGVMTVTIPFDRYLKLGEDAKVTMSKWGNYDSSNIAFIPEMKAYLITKPIESVVLSGDNLSIAENCLVITVPEEHYQAGMFVSFTFEDGTVYSLPFSEGGKAGIPNEAYEYEYLFYGEEEAYAGVWGRYPTENFALEADSENPDIIMLADWQNTTFKVASTNAIAYNEETVGEALYNLNAGTYTSERKASMKEFSLNETCDTMRFSLPVVPKDNEDFSFSINAGTIKDIYGNSNKAVEIEPVPVIEVLEITFDGIVSSNMINASSTPSTDKIYYYVDLGKDIDEVSDDELIAAAKAYIEALAEADKVSFTKEYVQYFAFKGEDTSSYYNLTKNTEYTAYGFFMKEDGTVMSEVFREKISTGDMVYPTEATGTYTYSDAFFGAGADAGLEAEFNATKDTLTIKNWGVGMDFKCAIDADGNANVPVQQVYEHPTVGPIYIAEIGNLTGRAKATSFYNVADKTLYLSVYYVYVGEDGFNLIGGGYNCETFCFDGSQPAEDITNTRVQKEFKLGNLGKVSSIAEPVKHKHICR